MKDTIDFMFNSKTMSRLLLAAIFVITSLVLFLLIGCGDAPKYAPPKNNTFSIEVLHLDGRVDTVSYVGNEATMFRIDSARTTKWLSAINPNTSIKSTVCVGVKSFRVVGKI